VTALRCIVTGAARGIGQATCRRLARRPGGARILAVDPQLAELAVLRDEIAAEGSELVAMEGDVTDPALPEAAVRRALDAFGGLDAVVSNAGFARHAPLVDLRIEDWDVVFAANVRAHWLFARAAFDCLKASTGSMVILGSISGMNPQIGLGAYSSSKAAAIMLARHLAVEWAGSGVRVNAVSPGPTHTATTGRYYSDPAVKAQRAGHIPLGRVGDAGDIADAIAFLVGPDASYCNGLNLVVDGGLSPAAMLSLARAGGAPGAAPVTEMPA
jgi:glucose 1-dehydrogenase